MSTAKRTSYRKGVYSFLQATVKGIFQVKEEKTMPASGATSTKVVFREERPRTPIVEDEKYRTITSLSELSGYSETNLRSLLSERKLEGTKVGDVWLSTMTAVNSYIAANGRERPEV